MAKSKAHIVGLEICLSRSESDPAMRPIRSVTTKKRGAVASSGPRPERREKPEGHKCPGRVFPKLEGLEPRREQAKRDNKEARRIAA